MYVCKCYRLTITTRGDIFRDTNSRLVLSFTKLVKKEVVSKLNNSWMTSTPRLRRLKTKRAFLPLILHLHGITCSNALIQNEM